MKEASKIEATEENFERFKNLLVEAELAFTEPEGTEYSVMMEFAGENFSYSFWVRVGSAFVWLLGRLPFIYKSNQRVNLLELTNEVNSNSPFGVFTVEGERIVFKSEAQAKHLQTVDDLRMFLLGSAYTVNEFLPRARALLENNVDAPSSQ